MRDSSHMYMGMYGKGIGTVKSHIFEGAFAAGGWQPMIYEFRTNNWARR